MSFASPQELHATFADAFAAADVDALVGLYETGAIQVQRDGRVLTGPENLRSVFVGLLGSGTEMSGTQQEALVAGDIALTSTRYEVQTEDANGDHLTAHLVTAEVSRRQDDGTWLVVIDAPAFA